MAADASFNSWTDKIGEPARGFLKFNVPDGSPNCFDVELEILDIANRLPGEPIPSSVRRVAACAFGKEVNERLASVEGVDPQLARRGHRLSFTMPEVGFVKPDSAVSWSSAFYLRIDEQFKIDSASNGVVTNNGLMFASNGVAREVGQGKIDGVLVQQASLTMLEGETGAQRGIFLAGAIVGLVGGLITWGGQLLVGATTVGRRMR
ncbi:hypothetical protein [Lentzea sp. CA-135723]|uniref:hypothetical protein n=1 Tax=Lentzea sp. CA-135723 TaxID=3239950 RepID=UPI003D8BF710